MAFFCESPDCVWNCCKCSRNFHSYDSLVQHLRRSHGVVSFAHRCWQCRELFSNRRSRNTHVRKCRGAVLDGTCSCPVCGEQFVEPSSLMVHKSFCSEAASSHLQEETESAITCCYCDKTWPSQRSLSQHVRNQHMALSQQDLEEAETLGISKNLDGRAEAGLPGRGRPSRLVKLSSDSQQSQLDRPADPEFQDQVPKGSLERGTVNSMETSNGSVVVWC